ncbi:MAG: peptide ABC transporter substrate-binding protein [Candidatus Brocadiales bacterium]
MFKTTIIIISIILALSAQAFFGLSQDEKAEFTFINGPEPETIDPALMTGVVEGRLVAALFEGLTNYDPKDLSPTPAIAKEWHLSDDGLTYTFHLRKSSWSNGEQLNAHDFVYSWKRALTPETAADYAYQLYYIKNARSFNEGALKDFGKVGVMAVDDYTLVATLERPTPFFLFLTAFPTLQPVNRRCIEKHGDDWTKEGNIVSNGPFRLKDWKINQKIRLVKNPRYWDAEHVSLSSIDVLTVESANTAFNTYETGGADLISTIPLPLIDVLKGRPDFHSSTYLGTYFYRFNVTKPPFNDVRVRRAFTMAVNKEEIVRYVTRGGEKSATSFVPPNMPGYEPPEGLPHDVEEARRLLAEAGYPDGKGFPRIELLFNTSEANKDIAEVVQQMFKKNLNINVSIINQEWKVLLNTMKRLDYQLCRSSWIGDYVDPNTFLDMFVTNGGNNRTGWSNSKYDSLITEATNVGAIHELPLQTQNKRMEIFREAERILLEEAPILPLYHYVSYNMFRPHVKGIYPNVLDIHPLKYVRIENPEMH